MPHSAVMCTTGEIISSCMIPEIRMFRGQDSRSSLLRCRAGALHGCIDEGNYGFGFFITLNKIKGCRVIVEWKNG